MNVKYSTERKTRNIHGCLSYLEAAKAPFAGDV